jgi:hypothetical protein
MPRDRKRRRVTSFLASPTFVPVSFKTPAFLAILGMPVSSSIVRFDKVYGQLSGLADAWKRNYPRFKDLAVSR